MTYFEFIQQTPVLYGSTVSKKGRQYIGSYEVAYNKYSNTFVYFFINKNGRINRNIGFTIKRAYLLYDAGRLSLDPEKGKIENYITY
jgi:hypothetical protein